MSESGWHERDRVSGTDRVRDAKKKITGLIRILAARSPSGHGRTVLFNAAAWEVDLLISLAYLICRVLLRVVVSGIRRIAKDVEILVLRHQLDVLHRQKGKTPPP